MDKDSSKSTDFIKVRNFLTLNRRTDLTTDGLRFSQEFQDRLNEADEFVRSKIIIPINDAVGLHNWAVCLHQNSTLVLCDIYADDKSNCEIIISILSNKLIDMNFELFKYKGTIADYKNNK